MRFTYDLNGILEVETTTVATGKTQQLVIEQRPGSLTRKEVDAARESMKKLKFHPRESLPNRTAMARAEAAFASARGETRDLLLQAIASFQAVLEGQRPAEIEEIRERLNALVSSLER